MQVGRACPLRHLDVQRISNREDTPMAIVCRKDATVEDAVGIAGPAFESLTLDRGAAKPRQGVFGALCAPLRLTRLHLSSCSSPKPFGPWNLAELAAATQLWHLHLEGSTAINTALLDGPEALQPLAGLTQLESVDVRTATCRAFAMKAR
jgi:hypothetical protein